MANYYATARTNYFKVKDEAAFRQWAEDLHCEVLTDGEDEHTFALLCSDEDGIPSSRYNNRTDEVVEVEFMAELAAHLQEDHVAIVQESGHEARRYVSAHAWAVNSRGEIAHVSLSDIYAKAAPLGKHITPCEY